MSISDVTNSLFRTAIPPQEVIQELSDEDCGFYNDTEPSIPIPVEVRNTNNTYFDDEYDDEEYDDEDYIEGECLDIEEFNALCTICTNLETAKRNTESEEHYFYISELNEMRSIINDIKDKAAELKEISTKYRTY